MSQLNSLLKIVSVRFYSPLSRRTVESTLCSHLDTILAFSDWFARRRIKDSRALRLGFSTTVDEKRRFAMGRTRKGSEWGRKKETSAAASREGGRRV